MSAVGPFHMYLTIHVRSEKEKRFFREIRQAEVKANREAAREAAPSEVCYTTGPERISKLMT